MRVLITGATGFAGGHLAEALLARGGFEVHALSRRGCWPDELRHLADKMPLRSCDLRDLQQVADVLRQTRCACGWDASGERRDCLPGRQ